MSGGRAAIDVIAFDADDTLWHNESLYTRAQTQFQELLATYNGDDGVAEELYKTEMDNLPTYGYGIKSFALSMIETAIRVTNGQIKGRDVQKIIDLAKEMKRTPVLLLDHVAEVIPALSAHRKLMLITKGDLFDQETKIARSGLAPYFSSVEIVTDKTPEVYQSLLEKHQINPERFLMVGNSLRSDILPVVSLGARAVHIPYQITWAHEVVPIQLVERPGYLELEHIGMLPSLVNRLDLSKEVQNPKEVTH
ncbi:MAG TPA: HAD family hydrolase [Anaerolineae bacterium]|nr:HAD family hydrolase [Anaerolineae bacterium]